MTLCSQDFANIKRRFPQTRRDGTINYAFAGGSAVNLLLEADTVQWNTFKDKSIGDEREHKDLEIYSFNQKFGRFNTNKHDICYVNFGGPLNRQKYNEEFPQRVGIWVELLNGDYFGSQLPTEYDVRKVISDKKRFYVLSPEFLITSKIFSPLGIRKGIDDVDSLALFNRFHIDYDYLYSLAQKTPYAKFIENVGDFDRIEKSLKKKREQGYEYSGFFGDVIDYILYEYEESLGFDFDPLDYNTLTHLLLFDPEKFEFSKRKEILHAEICRNTNGHEFYQKGKTEAFNLAMKIYLSSFPESELLLKISDAVLNWSSLKNDPLFHQIPYIIGSNINQSEISWTHVAMKKSIYCHNLINLCSEFEEVYENPALWLQSTGKILNLLTASPFTHVVYNILHSRLSEGRKEKQGIDQFVKDELRDLQRS
tara:strand:- start:186 stop:1457 length:1272 start_codon:yes stop_codon:yes gene_type:complete